MKCQQCNDTGKLPGSDYLDCTHCDAATERTALNDWLLSPSKINDASELFWAIHQRARQIEREAQAARIAELEEAVQRAHAALTGGRPDASAEVKKLAAIIGAAPSAPAVEQQPYGWAYECVQPGTDGKGWAEFFNRAKPTSEKGVRNIKPLYSAPLATDTDKVREAVKYSAGLRIAIENAAAGYGEFIDGGLAETIGKEAVAYLAASMAPQAPVERNIHGPLMIARIKRYRDVFGCTLKEAKEAVEFCRDLNSDQTAFLKPPTAQAPVREVPEGWQLVPKEPTEEMIQVACVNQAPTGEYKNYEEWWNDHSSGVSEKIRAYVASDYRAMLAAAPLPAAPVQKDTDKEQA